MTRPEGIRRTMRLLSAKPPQLARPQSTLELNKPRLRAVQSAAPGQLVAQDGRKPQRPVSKYRQEYEQEIDEIFEESQIIGALLSLQTSARQKPSSRWPSTPARAIGLPGRRARRSSSSRSSCSCRTCPTPRSPRRSRPASAGRRRCPTCARSSSPKKRSAT